MKRNQVCLPEGTSVRTEVSGCGNKENERGYWFVGIFRSGKEPSLRLDCAPASGAGKNRERRSRIPQIPKALRKSWRPPAHDAPESFPNDPNETTAFYDVFVTTNEKDASLAGREVRTVGRREKTGRECAAGITEEEGKAEGSYGGLEGYITCRYRSWLDYACYHCSRCGLSGEAGDVLNEVLCMLLEKEPAVLERLLGARHGNRTELDYFVLRMIKLNAVSPTSRYRYRYHVHRIPVDDSVLPGTLSVPDDSSESGPFAEADRYGLVEKVFDGLVLPQRQREVFIWRFFHNKPFAEWPGPESRKQLYKAYRTVVERIRSAIREV